MVFSLFSSWIRIGYREAANSASFLLFTDGEPDDPRKLAAEAYFQETRDFITTSLKPQGCDLYVIGIDAAGSTWIRSVSGWQRTLSPGQVYQISDMNELREKFNEAIRQIFGIPPVPPDVVTAKGFQFDVPPYLQKIEFHVFPEREGLTLSIFGPGNKPVNIGSESAPVQEYETYDIITIMDPPDGKWRYEIVQGEGRIEVYRNAIPIRMELISPRKVHPLGKPMDLVASFLRPDSQIPGRFHGALPTPLRHSGRHVLRVRLAGDLRSSEKSFADYSEAEFSVQPSFWQRIHAKLLWIILLLGFAPVAFIIYRLQLPKLMGTLYVQRVAGESDSYNLRTFGHKATFVDGSQIGGESGSAVKPFLGLLPAISDYILLHLTEGTSPDYAFLLTSMGQEVLRAREDPLGAGIYSTFGICKCIFDVEGVIQTFAHQLALDVLNWFLMVGPKSESEVKGEVQSFLKSPDNSNFNRNCVAYMLEHPGDMRPMKETLFSYLRFGTGENIELPTLTLIERVPTSKIFPIPSRVHSDVVRNEVIRLVNNNLGTQNDMATSRSRENSYYGVLNYYLEEHDRRFRSLLKERIGNIMKEDKGEGSLDHARNFLTRLEASYGQFIEQISSMFERSGSSERRKEAQEEVSRRRESMDGGSSQRAFLEARQRLLEFEQLELIMGYIINVAEAHQRFCQELLRQIDVWISAFERGRGQVQEAYND